MHAILRIMFRPITSSFFIQFQKTKYLELKASDFLAPVFLSSLFGRAGAIPAPKGWDLKNMFATEVVLQPRRYLGINFLKLG